MKVIITGSTGMVGKSVLLECIDSDKISEILLINRTSLKLTDSKVKELLLKDYSELETHVEKLKNYDACFHCMGVSAVGLSEEKYHYVTYELTKYLIDAIYSQNPNMVVNYVSGEGTDSTEKGKIMWARVKGKTENYIFNKGFKDAYAVRANMIIPEKGIKSKTTLYQLSYVLLRPLFPILKKTDAITTTTRLGKALINTLFFPQENKILHNEDLNKLARL